MSAAEAIPVLPRAQGMGDQTVLALRRLMLAGEQFRRAVAEHFGIGLSETVAISYLSLDGPLSPRQLADQVGLTPSTMTALLDRLEHAGLAMRHAHPTDRRMSLITLTERGHDLIAQMRAWLAAAIDVLPEELHPDAVAILTDLGDALLERTAAIRGHEDEPRPLH
jgi:DNA-binding MarR family transcriptional regulator